MDKKQKLKRNRVFSYIALIGNGILMIWLYINLDFSSRVLLDYAGVFSTTLMVGLMISHIIKLNNRINYWR
jgi:hypothetical protein